MKRTLDAVIDATGRISLDTPLHLDRSYRAILTVLGPIEGTEVIPDPGDDDVLASASEERNEAGPEISKFPSVAPLLEELEREATDDISDSE